MPQCSFNRPAAMMQATPVQNMFYRIHAKSPRRLCEGIFVRADAVL